MVLVRSLLLSTLLLCLYGLFKEIHPSEPFLTEYLTDPRWLNLTEDQVYQDVYPVWSYSFFSLLVPVFLLTDLLWYKPMILLGGVSYITTWCLLLWARGLAAMEVMQLVYGLGTATEVAYFTYIYTKVPKEDYTKVSGYVRSATLVGKCISGILGQILVSFEIMNYHDLIYISLSCSCVAVAFALFLPSVKTSIYFHRDAEQVTQAETINEEIVDHKEGDETIEFSSNANQSVWDKFTKVMGLIWADLYSSYSQPYVMKWSIWVAISSCLYFQIGNYIQPLWREIRTRDEDEEEAFNGAIEGISNLVGALTVFGVGFVKLRWDKHWGNIGILSTAVVGGAVLFWMSQTNQIWVAYIGYILFRSSYNIVITIASFEIAANISRSAYALIFGMNAWVGVGLQTILTLVVSDDDTFGGALAIQDQYIVYACLYWAAAIGFNIGCYAVPCWRWTTEKCQNNERE